MNEMELLAFARGPGLQIATAVLLAGVTLRLIEIFSLGRRPDHAVPRAGYRWAGFKTIFTRSFCPASVAKRSLPTCVLGYLFHLAFFVTLLFYLPHIKLFEDVLGLRWPGLPSTVVDAVAMVGIISMIATLVYRLRHPVKRMLSTYDDYLSWAVTFLPLLTGYLAYHHMLLPYTTMLAVHILSVELLMVTLPFTKLTHGFSVFISRWYNGSILGRKGAAL